jgi:hypothetical protein
MFVFSSSWAAALASSLVASLPSIPMCGVCVWCVSARLLQVFSVTNFCMLMSLAGCEFLLTCYLNELNHIMTYEFRVSTSKC